MSDAKKMAALKKYADKKGGNITGVAGKKNKQHIAMAMRAAAAKNA